MLYTQSDGRFSTRFQMKAPKSYYKDVLWADSTDKDTHKDWLNANQKRREDIINEWIEKRPANIVYDFFDLVKRQP